MRDPNSPIIDFYPQDFDIDMNGKKFLWQGVVLLPFIDEKRLIEAVEPIEESLDKTSKKRNRIGCVINFI